MANLRAVAIAWMVVALGVGLTTALAAEGGAAAPAGGGEVPAAVASPPAGAPTEEVPITPQQEVTFFYLLQAGGSIGWMIVALSFVMVALVIEGFATIRRDKFIPPDVLGELEELFQKQEYDTALELCEVERSMLTNVVGSGLAKINGGWTQMEAAMAEAAEEVSTKLYQKVGYLNLIGQVAPMLGLLGTVVGMVMAFMVIASRAGTPKPAELAQGIYTALITTVQGLVVAIPALSAYYFFRNRVAKLLLEAGAVTGELMERFRPKE